jgi:pimeloyl-ACP methyl ester carboxylesterase
MAGENDLKYVELAERMVQAIGENARLQIVKNSGHTPHLEQESVFVESIRSFIKQTS